MVRRGRRYPRQLGQQDRGQRERVWDRRRRTVAKYHQKGTWEWSGVVDGGLKEKVKWNLESRSLPNRGVGQDKERMCKGKT
jgi:hypothetical protein